jgi:hypothetical protein
VGAFDDARGVGRARQPVDVIARLPAHDGRIRLRLALVGAHERQLDAQVARLAVDLRRQLAQERDQRRMQRTVAHWVLSDHTAVLAHEHPAEQLYRTVLGDDPLLDHPVVLLDGDREDAGRLPCRLDG